MSRVCPNPPRLNLPMSYNRMFIVHRPSKKFICIAKGGVNSWWAGDDPTTDDRMARFFHDCEKWSNKEGEYPDHNDFAIGMEHDSDAPEDNRIVTEFGRHQDPPAEEYTWTTTPRKDHQP